MRLEVFKDVEVVFGQDGLVELLLLRGNGRAWRRRGTSKEVLWSSVNVVTVVGVDASSPTHSTLRHGDGTPPHLLAIFYPPTSDLPFDSCDTPYLFSRLSSIFNSPTSDLPFLATAHDVPPISEERD